MNEHDTLGQLSVLPESVIFLVLGFLSPLDLTRVSLVNRYCHSVVQSRQGLLWKRLAVSRGYSGLFYHPVLWKEQSESLGGSNSPHVDYGQGDRKSQGLAALSPWHELFIRCSLLDRNWRRGRYYYKTSRAHDHHITGLLSNQSTVLSVGKDGRIVTYERAECGVKSVRSMSHRAVIHCAVALNQYLIAVATSAGEVRIMPFEDIANFGGVSVDIGDRDAYKMTSCEMTSCQVMVAVLGVYGLVTVIHVQLFPPTERRYYSDMTWTRPHADEALADEVSFNNSRVEFLGVVSQFEASVDDIEVFLFDPTGRYLLMSSFECPVLLFESRTGACVLRLGDVCDPVYAALFSPPSLSGGGEYNCGLYTGSNDGTICVWQLSFPSHAGGDHDLLDLSLTGRMSHPPEVYCLAASCDWTRLVSGGSDSDVMVWSLATRQILHRLKGHIGIVRHLFVQNERLVSAGDQKRVLVWDLRSGVLHCTLHRNPSFIMFIRVDQFSVLIASNDNPGSVTAINFW